MKNSAISRGMKAAKKRGVKIGRPADPALQEKVEALAPNYTCPAISRLLGIPQSTVYAIINRQKNKKTA